MCGENVLQEGFQWYSECSPGLWRLSKEGCNTGKKSHCYECNIFYLQVMLIFTWEGCIWGIISLVKCVPKYFLNGNSTRKFFIIMRSLLLCKVWKIIFNCELWWVTHKKACTIFFCLKFSWIVFNNFKLQLIFMYTF